jgi:septal ring factor EnvC (AmiA/AmiB activator)
MANDKIQNLTNKIEENKKKIKDLKKQLKDSNKKNKSLKKEIDKLKEKNKTLLKRLQELKIKIGKQRRTLDKHETEINKLKKEREYQESVLCIVQIGTDIERNMCQYVLQDHFKNNRFYKVNHMESFITELSSEEQDLARYRRCELDKTVKWENLESLVYSLKNLKSIRFGMAHPKLTEKKIETALNWLVKEGKDQGMAETIKILKLEWKDTESLLHG